MLDGDMEISVNGMTNISVDDLVCLRGCVDEKRFDKQTGKQTCLFTYDSQWPVDKSRLGKQI